MKKKIILEVLKYLILIIIATLIIGPFFTIVKTSLQETTIITGAPNPHYTLINYIHLFTQLDFFRWTMNSIIFAGGATLIIVFIDSMAGYALVKYKFKGKNFIFSLVLASMMLPFAVLLFPLFKIVNGLGLLNTYPGLIFPMLANPFGVFLMRQFMLNIPSEIMDAAKIDGCSEYALFFRIIIPLSRPGQAVLAIITFMGTYTNFIWPLVITNKKEMFTQTVGLATIPGLNVIDWGLVCAGSLMTIIPILIVFLLYQKGFIAGLTMGAVKE